MRITGLEPDYLVPINLINITYLIYHDKFHDKIIFLLAVRQPQSPPV